MTQLPLRRSLAFCVCLLLAAPAWGGEDDGPARTLGTAAEEAASASAGSAANRAEAKALVDGGRFEDAVVMLGPLVRGGEVEADDLFLFGLAAVGASQQPGIGEARREALLDEAIASFRTMLVNRPELVRVRLELARAFFLKGVDSLARRHFERVLAGEPPEAVAANVRLFLLRIRARRRWDMHVGAAIAPDSNIGGGSDERTIQIFGLPFERDAEELTTSGVGLSVWGGGEYQHPLGERVLLRAGADLSRREHEGSAFDETFASTHVGPRFLIDRDTEVSVLAVASQRWAGTVKDFHAVGGRVEAGRRLSRSVTANGRLSWEDRHYRTRTSLDGDALDLSLGGAWVIAPTVRAEVSVGYGRERPEWVRERHERYRAGAGVSVILPRGFTVGGGGEYRWTNYEEGWFPHVPDGGAREDRTWSVRASVYNRGITVYGFSPEVAVVHEVRKTNAQLYDYDRTRGELRFVRQF